MFLLFDFILDIPVNNFSDMSEWIFLGYTSTQGLMCLSQAHNAVTPVRLERETSPSQFKHSTSEPLCSMGVCVWSLFCNAVLIILSSLLRKRELVALL